MTRTPRSAGGGGCVGKLLARPEFEGGHASANDYLEDVLDNSFRVFDRIEFALTGLRIRVLGQGRYAVSYSVAITGHIHQLNRQHKESGQVEDVVS